MVVEEEGSEPRNEATQKPQKAGKGVLAENPGRMQPCGHWDVDPRRLPSDS